MRKNIYFDFGLDMSITDRVKKIKQAGFDGVFIWFYEDRFLLNEVITSIKANGLYIETMHLPFHHCNDLWVAGEAGEHYVQNIIDGIRVAAEATIPTVIMHTVSKKTHPDYNPLGLKRIQKILNYCEEKKVQLAIENVRDIRYLDYVFDHVASPYLKICFDTGHTNCFGYQVNDFNWDKYKKDIVAVHIHDNDGKDDQHLLPFYGTINWEGIMKKLRQISFSAPLTSEARILDPRFSFTAEEFLKKTYQALSTLEQLFEDTHE